MFAYSREHLYLLNDFLCDDLLGIVKIYLNDRYVNMDIRKYFKFPFEHMSVNNLETIVEDENVRVNLNLKNNVKKVKNIYYIKCIENSYINFKWILLGQNGPYYFIYTGRCETIWNDPDRKKAKRLQYEYPYKYKIIDMKFEHIAYFSKSLSNLVNSGIFKDYRDHFSEFHYHKTNDLQLDSVKHIMGIYKNNKKKYNK